MSLELNGTCTSCQRTVMFVTNGECSDCWLVGVRANLDSLHKRLTYPTVWDRLVDQETFPDCGPVEPPE